MEYWGNVDAKDLISGSQRENHVPIGKRNVLRQWQITLYQPAAVEPGSVPASGVPGRYTVDQDCRTVDPLLLPVLLSRLAQS